MEKLKQSVENDISELRKIMMQNQSVFSQAINKINEIKYTQKVDMTDEHRELCNNEYKFIESVTYKLSAFKNFLLLANMEAGKMLYRDFYSLCTYLESLSLTVLDSFQILCTLIESNMKTGLLEKKVDEIPIFQFRMISYLEAYSFIYDQCYINEEVEKQTQNFGIDIRKKQIIKSYTSVDIPTLQATHQVIQQCYLNKKDTYTKEDIERIVEAFYQLKVPAHFCEAFKTKLNKSIEKRVRETTNPCTRQQLKLGLTDKEYKEKLKQIKEYYNGYTGEILKPIKEEQKSYLAMLMIELGYDRKDINQFYQDVNRNNLVDNVKMDGIKEFYMLYSKIEFYSKKKFELQELLEEATSYLFELFGCMEEDYGFWYQEFQAVLFKMKMMIPNTFDYEYAQAELLVEKEKQKRKGF